MSDNGARPIMRDWNPGAAWISFIISASALGFWTPGGSNVLVQTVAALGIFSCCFFVLRIVNAKRRVKRQNGNQAAPPESNSP
jgi:hypothetical protein